MTLTLAHITDQHLADTAHDVSTEDAHALVDALLDDDLDAVIDTGDWTGSGLVDQYRRVREVAGRLRDADVPYFLTPGNHDTALKGSTYHPWSRHRWEGYAADLDTHYEAGESWPRCYQAAGVRLILADTCADPTMMARGQLTEEQCERIASAADTGATTVLATHHCPSGGGASLRLVDRDMLQRKLRTAGTTVDVWLTGHLHRAGEWSDVFGARYLLASPMSVEAGRYRRLEIDGDAVEWGWGLV